MGPSLASPGFPIEFGIVLRVARDLGQDITSLCRVRGDESFGERGQIWGRVMRKMRLDSFPVLVAQRTSRRESGPLGMVAAVAPDLRTALERRLRSQSLWSDTAIGRIRQGMTGAPTIFEFLPVEGSDLGGRCRREMRIASAIQYVRDVTRGPVRPLRVCFSHAAPRELHEHEAFFASEIWFDADFDGFELDDDTLATPLPGADADLSQFLVEHLHAAAGDPPPPGNLEPRVRQAIRGRLGRDGLAMPAIARELGMSERTLSRRLAEQGARYHELLDRVRREVADELLADPDHRLSQVAARLGFSEASAFCRAYLRWTGRTPAAQRRARHPKSVSE